jgi:hypothetical protein
MIDICPVGALDQQAIPLQRPHMGAVAPQIHQPARLDWRQLGGAGEEQRRSCACVPLENEERQRMLDCRPRSLFLRSLEQCRPSDAPMLKQGGEWKDGRLANRSGICGQRLEPN